MAVKIVWAYAIVMMVGGMALLMYLRYRDSGGWPAAAVGGIGMAIAVGVGMRRGRRKRREIDAEEAARRD